MSLLISLVPILDLVYTLFFWLRGSNISTAPNATLSIILGSFSILLSWATLFLFLSILYKTSSLLTSNVKRRIAQITLFLILLCIAGYLIFVWSFTAINGYMPSNEVVEFLAQNLSRLPDHILQTSPIIAVSFAIATLGLAFLSHLFFIHQEIFQHQKQKFIHITAIIGTSIAWMITAPYAPTPSPVYSALLISNKIDIARSEDIVLSRKKPYIATDLNADKKGPVIVILVESLRRDLISKEPTPIPFLQSLHRESVVFDKSYATASHSNYADLSFWYSQYPLRTMGLQRYPKNADWRGDSLFGAFKTHGYATAYISSQNEQWGKMINWLKTDDVDYFYHSEDFEGDTWFNKDDKQGIKLLIEKGIATAGKIEDSKTIEVAKRWINSLNNRKDFFLGLNLQNTHFSYVVPIKEIQPFQPSDMKFDAIYYRWPKKYKNNVKNRYLNAVYNVDRILKGFVDYLKQNNIWDQATFVVIGDSGEAFYEHGFGNHSGPMYDEVMRTYSIIKPPRGNKVAPGIYEHPISHIDLAAGVLDIAGMPVPGSFQGISPFSGKPNRSVYMHTNAIVKQNAIVDWPWKLMRTYYPRNMVELYNLEDDPEELNNVSSKNSEITTALNDQLNSWMAKQLTYYGDPLYYTRFNPPK